MKTTISHILSGYGVELFVHDDNVLLTYQRSVIDLDDSKQFITSKLKDFAFACPKRKAAYKAMAGENESDQLKQCVKCMFANFDGTPDLTDDGKLTPEYVDCAKRHYCAHVGIGCLPTKKVQALTSRENSLLPFIHLPNKEIAKMLFISEHTVKTHIKSINKKLGVSRKPEIMHSANQLIN